MIGGKHLQRGTNRELTYQAFFTETGPTIFIAAIIQEGDRLLAQPEIDVSFQPADGTVEDVVVARLVRYMNETTFGDGTGLDTGWYNRRVHFGPWM